MVYYVYLDPGVIRVAAAAGDAGLSCLASLLKALGENCCVVEFDDWRVNQAIAEEIKNLGANADWTKKLKMLLAHLSKQKRFIVALKAPEAHPPISDVTSAGQQAAAAELDAIVTSEPVSVTGTGAQVINLFAFAGSHFDLSRSQHATQGTTLAGGEHTTTDFYSKLLRKLLRYAQSVDFLDPLFGGKYGDHFKFTFRAIVREFASGRHESATNQITVHTANSTRIPHCRIETPTFHADIKVTVEAYDSTGANPTLPHERYLLTDQFALEIGRGLDLFDRDTNLNRDVSLSFKSPKEIQSLLNKAAASKLLGAS